MASKMNVLMHAFLLIYNTHPLSRWGQALLFPFFDVRLSYSLNCMRGCESAVLNRQLTTVNSEIFVSTLFSQNALKFTFVM